MNFWDILILLAIAGVILFTVFKRKKAGSCHAACCKDCSACQRAVPRDREDEPSS